jgi:hypothetical protein
MFSQDCGSLNPWPRAAGRKEPHPLMIRVEVRPRMLRWARERAYTRLQESGRGG